MPLFEKEEIHQDLHLMVAESQDESKFVVYGEMYVPPGHTVTVCLFVSLLCHRSHFNSI